MKIKRLKTYIIDAIIIGFISIFVMAILTDLFNLGYFKNILIVYFFVFNIYYLLCEYFWLKTLGKKVSKTRIILLNEDQNRFIQVLKRTLARLIPFDPISGLFNEEGIMWHDTLSNTKVIKND